MLVPLCFSTSISNIDSLPLLDGTVDLDVDNITDAEWMLVDSQLQVKIFLLSGFYSLVHLQVGVQGDHALLAKVPAEGILRSR